jgi:hypothetical protein
LTDTAVVSIVGIAVSGVVGPGVAALWARRRQRADHRHERHERRYEDLVCLLDDAAQLLAPGGSHLRAIADGELDRAELGAWPSQVHATYERLLLRLSADDPVSVAYCAARDRLVEVAQAFDEKRSHSEINELFDRFEGARVTFLERARECLAAQTGER